MGRHNKKTGNWAVIVTAVILVLIGGYTCGTGLGLGVLQ